EGDDAGDPPAEQGHDARVLEIATVAEIARTGGGLPGCRHGPVRVDGVDLLEPRVLLAEPVDQRSDERRAARAGDVREGEAPGRPEGETRRGGGARTPRSSGGGAAGPWPPNPNGSIPPPPRPPRNGNGAPACVDAASNG